MYKYIGRRIYYLKDKGNVVLNTGERKGDIRETSVDEDFSMYNQLSRYNKEKIDVLELKFGEYKTEFSECTSYRVNPDTKKLEFDYTPIPEKPNTPVSPSILDRINTLEAEMKTRTEIDNEHDVLLTEMFNYL